MYAMVYAILGGISLLAGGIAIVAWTAREEAVRNGGDDREPFSPEHIPGETE